MILIQRISIAAAAIAYTPMLWIFFQQQWSRPHSQFFPFVIGAAGLMFWLRWKDAPAAAAGDVGGTPRGAVWLVAVAWVALLLAVAMFNPWLSAASLVLLMAAHCLAVSRQRAVTYVWGIWATLWLILPLPLGMDQRLIAALQLGSSKLSSFVLDACGVAHLMAGNTLLLAERQLFVDEACSGIVSVMSIVACGVIYGVWRNRPPLHVAALAAGGVFWAAVMNVLRIVVITLVLERYGLDWTAGTAHELISLVIFLVAFSMLLSTDWMLVGVMAPVEREWLAATGTNLRYGRSLAVGWDRLLELGSPLGGAVANGPAEAAASDAHRSPQPRMMPASPRFVAIAFGGLGALQLAFLVWAYAHPIAAAPRIEDARKLGANSLPASLADLRQAGFDSTRRERGDIFGEYSRTYTYVDHLGGSYQLSCDFPFSQGWHELTVCYAGVGWEIATRQIQTVPGRESDESWTFAEARLARRDGAEGYIAWAIFDENGEPVSPPTGAVRDELWRLLVRRNPLAPARQMFQVQVFVESPGRVDERQMQQAQHLLLEAREWIREVVTATSEGTD